MSTVRSRELGLAEQWKLGLLARGMAVDPAARAHLDGVNHHRALTPADYASTSGLILVIDGDVWVNAPIAEHNASLVTAPRHVLALGGDGLVLRSEGEELPVAVWLPPAFHDTDNEHGEPYNSYAFTHADRVRISPVEGCSMTCKFCDLPYEFRYRTKRVGGLVDAVARAVADPVQPAHHVLISGGTPRATDIGYVRECYERVVAGFPELDVDIMMVPIEDLMDPEWLADIGVAELSVNLEVFNEEIAHRLMRQKAKQGRDHYLAYLERAAKVFGPGRVRSMLMVGLEPMADTLEAVDAIARRGAVPVLSPFRPDPSTPLRDLAPPPAEVLAETYLRALDIALSHDSALGPDCIPCTHNTLTFAASGAGTATSAHGSPLTVR